MFKSFFLMLNVCCSSNFPQPRARTPLSHSIAEKILGRIEPVRTLRFTEKRRVVGTVLSGHECARAGGPGVRGPRGMESEVQRVEDTVEEEAGEANEEEDGDSVEELGHLCGVGCPVRRCLSNDEIFSF